MTEMYVLMAAFLPLVVGIPMIGATIDVEQRAVQASRYAAWETTVSADGHTPDDIEQRFFSDRMSAGESTMGNSTPVSVFPYESAYEASPVHGVAGVSKGGAFAIGGALDGAAELAADLTGGDWGFAGNGLLRAGVGYRYEANDWLERQPIVERAVIMSDVWSVGEDESAAKRARSFVPAGVLDKLGIDNMLGAVGYLPMYTEMRSIEGAFGHVDMSPLPVSEMARRELRAYGDSSP